MRLKVNLAQKPFYNRKLFWVSFLALMGLTLWAAQWTVEKIGQTKEVSRKLEETIKKQELELEELRKVKPPEVETLTPKQLKELEDAAELIKQRRFSWTRLMEEFEQALPKEVRIISITPSRDTETTDIPLSIKVYAKSVEDLTKMITKMDKEGIFLVNPTNQEAPIVSGDIGFSLDVSYKPRPANIKIAKSKKTDDPNQPNRKVVNKKDDDDDE
jgi:Tfp pilus assembly protein PilN